MSHNGPNPDRFIQNHPRWRAIGLVDERYGSLSWADAELAIGYIERQLAVGIPAEAALEAFEGRPMEERRVGPPPRYPTAYGYDER